MDTNSAWEMAMGNQCPPLHPLPPYQLLNSTKEDPLLHQTLNKPSSSHEIAPHNFSLEHLKSNVPLEGGAGAGGGGGGGGKEEEGEEELGVMKEMMYKIAVMQPVDIDPATIRKPKRRNVRISDDPQSVAARHRRERISERIRILQRLVPGGIKMDTASMLDEAIRYVKFLKRQVQELQNTQHVAPPAPIADLHVGPIDMGLTPTSLGPHEEAGFSLPEMANLTTFSHQ